MTAKEKEALKKCVDACEGKSFAELTDVVAKQQSKEFPDFGGDVPEGEYYLIRKFAVHPWTNRQGTQSEILTAFLANIGTGKVVEVAFAAFCAREWDFVTVDKTGEEKVVEMSPILPFQSKLSDRTKAVSELAENTKVIVKHSFGHFKNPYNTRIFNFKYTWVEGA